MLALQSHISTIFHASPKNCSPLSILCLHLSSPAIISQLSSSSEMSILNCNGMKFKLSITTGKKGHCSEFEHHIDATWGGLSI